MLCWLTNWRSEIFETWAMHLKVALRGQGSIPSFEPLLTTAAIIGFVLFVVLLLLLQSFAVTSLQIPTFEGLWKACETLPVLGVALLLSRSLPFWAFRPM